MSSVTKLQYRRSRFSTRLPGDCRYTAAHFWLRPVGDGTWRVGFTQFATRMLGELVEHGFEVQPGSAIALGQTLGWLEAFKATSDLYSAGTGEFVARNESLDARPDRFDRDPYGAGFLYQFRGEPDRDAVDATGYARMLDSAIDKVLGPEAHS